MDALCDLISYGADFNLNEIDGKTALFFAAKNDCNGVVRRLHSKGLDLSVTDDQGKTAVFYANEHKSINVLCELICFDVDFNLNKIDGKAALFFAAKNDSCGVVRRLHSKGLNLNVTDDQGKTAVFHANENNSVNALCTLIDCDADFNLDEIDGKAALFYAAKNDYDWVVDRLYSKGLDLDVTDDQGKTAVFYANENNSVNALCTLIECDADFNLDEIDGKGALFCAVKNDYDLVVVDRLYFKGFDLNVTDDQGKTAVFYAKENNNMKALCDLILWGAKFNLDEIDGKAVLFFAAENDCIGVVDELHSHGLDLNVTDDQGKTAVFHAKENNSVNALCALIGCYADFNLDEIDGKAALFYAAKNDYDWVVDRLYSKGLDLNVTDDQGKTAVFYANENNNMKALCDLICWGAKFNLDEIDGKAILFYSAKNDRKSVVKPLYEAGLDLNITDDQGRTVAFDCNQDFLDTLMKMDDVFLNARDQYGRTPLFYALQESSLEKARFLIENGGKLELRDNCNLNIFSFFVENCLSKDRNAWQLFTSELFEGEQQRKALILAIFDTIYCQTPLLSVGNSSHLSNLYKIFNKTNILKALAFARNQCLIHDADKIGNIETLALIIREDNIDAQLILSLLDRLGANPNAADSAGNTAVHYASILPLFGVTQEAVMDMCKLLKKFGASFNLMNHQRQTPLLFGLSSHNWKAITSGNNCPSSIRGLVKVCKFLLNSGCNITETSQNSGSIFHRIISLMQLGLELNEDASRIVVSQVLFEVLMLISDPNKAVLCSVVNSIDIQLNSPLHLWASTALKSQQEYASRVTPEHTFESFLRIIQDNLLKCGAKLNPRNGNEETPLHMCRTWTAMKLLLDVGANPDVVDASGRSPLLAAAMDKNYPKKPGCFYSDVTEDPQMFWKSVFENGLDSWVADEEGITLLSVLIGSEDFVLTKALIEVYCKESYAIDEVKLSILNVICKDKSKYTHWKTFLVDIILNSTGASNLSLNSPLRCCCKNIIEFGVLEDKRLSSHKNTNDGPNNDGQPPPKKRKKSEWSKEEIKDLNIERICSDSVHCKIVQQLLSHGADIHIRDSSGMSCLDIAKDCPPLQDLLQKPIEINTLPIRIPWTSISGRFKDKLAKVARQHECKILDQIWHHKDHIGSGSFGLIFCGINEKDGREVAVKRIEKLRMHGAEDKREIQNLTALADCEQVVRYTSFFEKEDFSYVVLELMEGNLEELFGECCLNAIKPIALCKDIVTGLEFLHERNILHRDLKPRNILYKEHPKPCLKIADFGLSRNFDGVSATTVYGSLAGTRCWMAPEVLKNPNRFESTSDMFSCGLLHHYILSGQKHPFSPSDFSNKSELQVSHETEANILNDQLEGWDDSVSPEATHLVKRMLGSNKDDRPSAHQALEHPLFWSNGKKKDVLEVVGNQQEFTRSRAKRTPPLTQVETDLETSFGTIVKHGNWTSSQYKNMPQIYREMTKGKGRRYYDTSSAVELVRFIRNVYEHSDGITLAPPVSIKDLLFTDFVFLKYFPNLVMEVYKAVTTHGWDQARDDIKFVMNKE